MTDGACGGGGGLSEVLWLGPDGGIRSPFGNIPKLMLDCLCKMVDETCGGGGGGLSEVLGLGPDGVVRSSFDSIPTLEGGSKSGTLLGFPVEKRICLFGCFVLGSLNTLLIIGKPPSSTKKFLASAW